MLSTTIFPVQLPCHCKEFDGDPHIKEMKVQYVFLLFNCKNITSHIKPLDIRNPAIVVYVVM